MPIKPCSNCPQNFSKPVNCSRAKWATREFCSRPCAYNARKGNPSWNAGLNLSTLPQYSAMGFRKSHPRFTKTLHSFTSFERSKAHIAAKQNGTHGGKGTKRPNMSGPKHFHWKADRSQLVDQRNRSEPAYIEWRRQVWRRDMYKCKIADNDCKGGIEAHHILPWAQFPELRYQINNGITLCHYHHPRTRLGELLLSPFFEEMVTEAN